MTFDVVKVRNVESKKTGKAYTKALLCVNDPDELEPNYVSIFLPQCSLSDIRNLVIRKKGSYGYCLLGENNVFDCENVV